MREISSINLPNLRERRNHFESQSGILNYELKSEHSSTNHSKKDKKVFRLIFNKEKDILKIFESRTLKNYIKNYFLGFFEKLRVYLQEVEESRILNSAMS